MRLGVGLFYVLASALALGAVLLAGGGAFALIGWLAYTAHLAQQTARIREGDPLTALTLFRSNRDAGLLLFGGLALQGWAG